MGAVLIRRRALLTAATAGAASGALAQPYGGDRTGPLGAPARPGAGDAGPRSVSSPPSLVLDFTTGTLPPGLTFTRASTATSGSYLDAAGSTYTTLAVNAPRFTASGLLMEDARTNFLLNSDAPVTQTVSTAARTYILWVIGSGSATIASAGSVGSGFGTAVAGSPVTVVITAGGNSTITVAGSLTRFQLESVSTTLVNTPTSYIPTAGAAATRTVEQCAMPTGAWFNQAAFSIAAEALSPLARAGGINGMAQIDDGTTSNYVGIHTQAGTARFVNVQSGATDAGGTPPGAIPTVPFAIAGTITAGNLTAANNGGAVVTAAPTHYPPATLSRLLIGTSNGGNYLFNGFIRRVRVWPRVLSNGELYQATVVTS